MRNIKFIGQCVLLCWYNSDLTMVNSFHTTAVWSPFFSSRLWTWIKCSQRKRLSNWFNIFEAWLSTSVIWIICLKADYLSITSLVSRHTCRVKYAVLLYRKGAIWIRNSFIRNSFIHSLLIRTFWFLLFVKFFSPKLKYFFFQGYCKEQNSTAYVLGVLPNRWQWRWKWVAVNTYTFVEKSSKIAKFIPVRY